MDDSPHQGMPGSAQNNSFNRLLRRLNSNAFHGWTQSSALLIAAAWGIYTFIWQDILVPSWAPAHVNIGVSMKANASKSGGEATHEEALLTIKADNTSSRKLYLLSNYWQLYGNKHIAKSPTAFQVKADQVLRHSFLTHAERESDLEFSPLLATGRVFDDTLIQPGESITRSISIRIPKRYSSFTVNIVIPALTREPREDLFKGKQLQWGLGKDEVPIPLLCSPATTAQRQAGYDRNVSCEPTPVDGIEKDLKVFDGKMNIFSRNEQLMPHASGS